MAGEGRDQMVVIEIIRKGTQAEKSEAIKYLQSVSAKAEADIVSVSNAAQNRIIVAVERIKTASLMNYDTQSLKKTISATLGKMASDVEVLSRRMITANILIGKIKSVFNSSVQKSVVLSSILLTDADKERIEKMVVDTVSKVKHGADLALASVMSLIQKASIRSNMPVAAREGDANDKAKALEQEPVSSEFSGESVEDKKASVSYREKPLTQEEISQIRLSPSQFVASFTASNLNAIKAMQTAYQQSVVKNQQLIKKSEKSLDKTDVAKQEILNIGIEMRKHGVSAFVDKGGKRWSLLSYCSMTARTTSTESNNAGEVFGDEEHDLYYIVPHGGSCPLCAKYEGKIYSRSGKDKRYPPLASVFKKIDHNGSDDLDNTYMSIHPNCRHKIVKYIDKKKNKR